MKIDGIVVNPQNEFVGMILSGEASELGFMNSDKITQFMDSRRIYDEIQKGLKITKISGAVLTKSGTPQFLLVNNTYFYQFPMYRLDQEGRFLKRMVSGQWVDTFDNGMELVTQCVMFDPQKKRDVVVGYGVSFGYLNDGRTGKPLVLNYPAHSIAVLSTYFKPVNFRVVEIRPGEISFRGKTDVSLKALPITRVDAQQAPVQTQQAKQTQQATPTSAQAVNSEKDTTSHANMHNARTDMVKKGEHSFQNSAVDFLDVVAIAAKARAMFVYLPNTNGKYESLTVEHNNVESSFIPSSVEIAFPDIEYSMKSGKTNLQFRKIGKVNVSYNGNIIPVPCQSIAAKSVFNYNQKHMLKFMLSVPAEEVEMVQTQLTAKTMSFTVCQDHTLCSLVNSAIGTNARNNVLLDIDTTQLIPMSPSKSEEALKSNPYMMINNINQYKAIDKWLSYKLDVLAQMLPGTALNKPRAEYAAYNPDMLATMKAFGIDPVTGLYTAPEEERPKAISADSLGYTAIDIDFNIPGFKAPTKTRLGSQFEEMCVSGEAKFLAPAIKEIKGMQNELLNIDARDIAKMNNKLNEWKKKNSAALKAEIRKLWRYNQAALTLGDYRVYKDGKDYTNAASRMKTGKAYTLLCGDKILSLKLKGVEVAPEQVK